MVEIQSAVKAAIEFARVTLGPDRTRFIRLEEIESSHLDGKEVWLITLSSARTDEQGLAAVLGPLAEFQRALDGPREYKVFAVSKDTGDILAMKIRVLVAPAA